jgi:hypothetical protein
MNLFYLKIKLMRIMYIFNEKYRDKKIAITLLKTNIKYYIIFYPHVNFKNIKRKFVQPFLFFVKKLK